MNETNQAIIVKLLQTFVDEIITDEDPSIKNDVVNQLAAIVSSSEVNTQFEQLTTLATELATRYKAVPRDVANIIGYINEVLDIPAGTPTQAETALLCDLVNKATSTTLAVSSIDNDELKDGLPVLANNNHAGFLLEHSSGQYVVYLIRLTQNDTRLIAYNDTNVIVGDFAIAEQAAVLKVLNNYTVQKLIQELNAIEHDDYRIKLMEEREQVQLEIDTAYVNDYLNSNADTLLNDDNAQPQRIIDLIINKYALENNLDLSNKRIELPNGRELVQQINTYLNTPTPTSAAAIEHKLIDVTPVSVETPVLTEAKPEQVVTSVEQATTIAIDKLIANPEQTLEILNRNELYNESITVHVENNVPTIMQRATPLTANEKNEVQKVLQPRFPEIYAVAEARRKEQQSKYEASRNKFTADEILVAFNHSPSHVEFTTQLKINISHLCEKIADYFNDNNIDLSHTLSRKETIDNMLNVLALYEYNPEAIASEDFRRANVPSSDNIIFDTLFIKKLVKKNFEAVTIEDDEVAIDLGKNLENTPSLLDLTPATLKTILGTLSEKQRVRVNSMYLVRGRNVNTHGFNPDTDSLTIDNNYATIAVLKSGSAEILYVYYDNDTAEVNRSIVIDKVSTRMQLVEFLDQ